jgi:hypothetical protein
MVAELSSGVVVATRRLIKEPGALNLGQMS